MVVVGVGVGVLLVRLLVVRVLLLPGLLLGLLLLLLELLLSWRTAAYEMTGLLEGPAAAVAEAAEVADAADFLFLLPGATGSTGFGPLDLAIFLACFSVGTTGAFFFEST